MKIVIIGDGKVGHKLTIQLSEENYDVVLIDQNEGKLKEALNSDEDLNSVYGVLRDGSPVYDNGDEPEVVIGDDETSESSEAGAENGESAADGSAENGSAAAEAGHGAGAETQAASTETQSAETAAAAN